MKMVCGELDDLMEHMKMEYVIFICNDCIYDIAPIITQFLIKHTVSFLFGKPQNN